MKKVYIASPFFNEDQINHVKNMEVVLESRGYDVYSPMRDGVVLKPDATVHERLATYYENLRAMNEADFMVAILNDRDTGTTFEQGYFAGKWEAERLAAQSYANDNSIPEDKFPLLKQKTPRVITFATNGKPVNVMLLGGTMMHCGSWEELGTYLDHVDERGLDNAIRDPESIGTIEVY